MLATILLRFGALCTLNGLVAAQFPPTPEGVTVLKSQIEEGIQISYKEVAFQLKSPCPHLCANFEFRVTYVRQLKECGATQAMFDSPRKP